MSTGPSHLDAVSPLEDVERQPDGVPHRVVGITALLSVMLAIVIVGIFVTSGFLGRVLAILLALFSIPVLVSKLRSKAARERDRSHPSR